MELDFSVLEPYLGAFLRGAELTVVVSVVSFGLGTLLGVLLGLAYWFSGVRTVALVANDAVRALPPLVLLFFVYYFPYQSVLGLAPPNAIVAGIAALAFAQAAYTADLVVSALRNVPNRLVEAGTTIGLSDRDLWRYIVIPDVYRQLFAPHIAFFIGVVRLSSLVAVIGGEDTVYVARIVIAQTFHSIEPWLLVGAIYIVVVTPIAVGARALEQSKWISRRG